MLLARRGVGEIGFKDVFGMNFDQGNLLGYTDDRKLISIDTETGKGTFVRDVTGVNSELWGATAPLSSSDNSKKVPEPTTLLGLLGIGAFGVSSQLSRKKRHQASNMS